MKKIKNQLIEVKRLFEHLIKEKENLIICGSTALSLHGLVTKSPEDIDIIIFEPTDVQKKIIQILNIATMQSYSDNAKIVNEYQRRSHKVFLNNVKIDFLFYNKNIDTNDFLLLKIDESLFLPIQPIEEVMIARRSYGRRPKDLESSLRLKSDNFNIL